MYCTLGFCPIASEESGQRRCKCKCLQKLTARQLRAITAVTSATGERVMTPEAGSTLPPAGKTDELAQSTSRLHDQSEATSPTTPASQSTTHRTPGWNKAIFKKAVTRTIIVNALTERSYETPRHLEPLAQDAGHKPNLPGRMIGARYFEPAVPHNGPPHEMALPVFAGKDSDAMQEALVGMSCQQMTTQTFRRSRQQLQHRSGAVTDRGPAHTRTISPVPPTTSIYSPPKLPNASPLLGSQSAREHGSRRSTASRSPQGRLGTAAQRLLAQKAVIGQRMKGKADWDQNLADFFECASYTAARAQGYDLTANAQRNPRAGGGGGGGGAVPRRHGYNWTSGGHRHQNVGQALSEAPSSLVARAVMQCPGLREDASEHTLLALVLSRHLCD